MAIRTHNFQQYPPRTISKKLFRKLVESFDQFKPGLPTSARKIKAQAISLGKITNLEGIQSWQVVDSHALSELEHVHVELLLVSTQPKDSCEIHIEFRATHIGLSVSDIQTGWGKAVFEEGKHLVAILGITPVGWVNYLRRLYSILELAQNVSMVIAVGFFALWLNVVNNTYMYAAVGLFIAGVIPTFRRLFAFAIPPKSIPIMQEASPKELKFPWVEAGAVLIFLAAVLSLVKELLLFFVTK